MPSRIGEPFGRVSERRQGGVEKETCSLNSSQTRASGRLQVASAPQVAWSTGPLDAQGLENVTLLVGPGSGFSFVSYPHPHASLPLPPNAHTLNLNVVSHSSRGGGA